jgi:N-acetylglucosamine-6-phosphate deacetylase
MKSKLPPSLGFTPGVVDIHFHGAFGIDLMKADQKELDQLSRKLWAHGIAAFCATTLSEAPAPLRTTVARLGSWIRTFSVKQGAIPLGIHLEGPFIHPAACGAHPSEIIRPVDMCELDDLWDASQHTLKILTIAPETLDRATLSKLTTWASSRKIILSLGHSRATEIQAKWAFDSGFRGVTHAWNALPFHHRSPGPLGAAIGRKDVYLELILDQIHVDPTLIRWTRNLHPDRKICFVSDCAPAAATRGKWCSFGPLQVRYHQGACRLPEGQLAGGGLLLPEAFSSWLKAEAESSQVSIKTAFLKSYPNLTTAPLYALRIPSSLLKGRRIEWKLTHEGLYLPRPEIL